MIDIQKMFWALVPKPALVLAKVAAQGNRSAQNSLYRAFPDTTAQMIVDAQTEVEKAAKSEKNT